MASSNGVPPDVKQMLAEVCAQHNIRIDRDDPAVAVVTLNHLVIESALARVTEQIRAATVDLEHAPDHLQVRAGTMLAQEMRVAIRNVASQVGQKDKAVAATVANPGSPNRIVRWMLLGAFIAASLFGSGVWLGTLLR